MKSRRGSTSSPISSSKRFEAVDRSSVVDPEDRTRGRIHRRLPELFRIHLAEALVALDVDGPLALPVREPLAYSSRSVSE